MPLRQAFRLPHDFAAVSDQAWRRMDAATGFLTEREGRFLALAAACGPESGAILEIGTLLGVPMRPEQIQDLMRAMNVLKIAETNPEESNSGDGTGEAR